MRQRWIAIVVLVALLGFAAKLVEVQLVDGPGLAENARMERETTTTVPAQRGDILDTNGVVLATSEVRYTVWVDQTLVATWDPAKDPDAPVVDGTGALAAARAMAPVLDVPAAELGAALNGTKRYKVVARDVLPATWRVLQGMGITGLGADPTQQRVYPSGTTAANLLGYVNSEQQGAGGLERQLDATLSGTPGSETYERGRGGQKIPDAGQTGTAAVPGSDVTTTVDQDIQYKAQTEADAAVSKTGASWVVVVVEDSRTGAVLALADSGTKDPNDPSVPADQRGSQAVQWTFEPGSTGKVITMANLLEHGVAKPTSKYTVGYTYAADNGEVFHDSHEHGTEKLTLAGILAESSNSGTVQAGSALSSQAQYDMMRKFGLGQATGLGLPGESSGLVREPAAMDGRSRYAVLFGQALTVNAVQVADVFSTVANGGVRPPAHLVQGTTGPDGVYHAQDPGRSTRVVSQKTASQLTRMLESVVDGEDGTGAKAAVPGYRVAGKTGTAEAAGANGSLSSIVASFVGFAPADDPRLTVGVFVKDPKSSIFGGETAAPVFSKVMGFSLDDLGVAPSGTKADPYKTTW
ncbi:peptidoglycan D,D-transpeptidase FtsI family protein [Luteimicrobium subarcticum]|uniref:Peptidoglycan synthetase FtsI n=1 Tax=Luteimicrobium subarcticum TaxID=620910 RepID=A0A2M8WTR3_9MICO|nr:penicillin-binding protein 2 [Luteimicrobium subarcticum]PJI94343.1 peptidoglycan synthetase FtsI [Luteimicrobium subarcticum]